MNENPRYETQKKSPELPFTPEQMQIAAKLVVKLTRTETHLEKSEGPRNLQKIFNDTVTDDTLH